MNRLAAPLVALTLAGCNPQQLADAQRYQADIAAVCQQAMIVAPFFPKVAPWLVGACESEAAIAKLALDPSSLTWLKGILGLL